MSEFRKSMILGRKVLRGLGVVRVLNRERLGMIEGYIK